MALGKAGKLSVADSQLCRVSLSWHSTKKWKNSIVFWFLVFHRCKQDIHHIYIYIYIYNTTIYHTNIYIIQMYITIHHKHKHSIQISQSRLPSPKSKVQTHKHSSQSSQVHYITMAAIWSSRRRSGLGWPNVRSRRPSEVVRRRPRWMLHKIEEIARERQEKR